MKRTSFAILIGLFCLFPALFSQVRSEFLLEKNWKFQEVIPLRQYQLRSMFPGRDREMLGEDRVGVAQYQMAKAERQPLLFHRQVLGT